jgi:hypothetical protein
LLLKDVFGTIRKEYGVVRETISRDMRELSKELGAKYDSETRLELEIEGVLNRLRERASGTTPQAQKADEVLLRFLVGSLSKHRLKQLGHQVEQSEARLAKLREEELEAKVSLAQAEAALARARSERVDKPLVVVLRDLGAGVTDEDIAKASPTFAGEGES